MRRKHVVRKNIGHIPRTGLFSRLSRYLNQSTAKGGIHRRIVCIVASAGYGKTTTLANWIERTGQRAAWFNMKETDDTPFTFYGGLLDVLASASRSCDALRTLRSDTGFAASPVEHTLSALHALQLTKQERKRLYLVIDDTHWVKHRSIVNSFSLVFSALPSEITVFLLGRGGQLIERMGSAFGALRIDENQLRFSAGEVRKCFVAAGHEISGSEAGDIATRTKGWPIAIAAMAGIPGAESTIREISSQANVHDILTACIAKYFWEPCDRITKDVLLHTCVVDEITPQFCDRLTGRTDGRDILKRFAVKGLLTRVVEETYIHHPLFRNFLNERIQEENPRLCEALHRIASDYYFENGDGYRSIRHALRSRDRVRITRALQEVMRYNQRNNSIAGHVDKISLCLTGVRTEEILAEHPYFYANLAWHAHLVGDARLAAHYFDGLYRVMPEIAAQHGEFLEQAVVLHMLDHRMPLGSLYDRIPKGMLEQLEGKDLRFPGMAKNLPFAHKGAKDISGMPGMPESTAIMDNVNVLWRKGKDTFVATMRAGLWYEKNELEQALHWSKRGIEALPVNTMPDIFFCAHMIHMATLDALERKAEAEERRETLFSRLKEMDALYLLPNLLAYEAKLRIQDGDTEAAKEWLGRYYVEAVTNSPGNTQLELFRIFQHLTTARALIVTSPIEQARSFLRDVVRLAADFRRTTDHAEALLLCALLEWHRGEKREGMHFFQKALTAAQLYYYIRFFADEGAAVLPLIKKAEAQARKKGAEVAHLQYLRDIRIAAYTRAKYHIGMAEAMRRKPIKLSPRQLEVLSYFAQGYRRDEIAGVTGMAPATVQTHTSILYVKLAVDNRHDAVRKARELGFIE